MTSLPNKLKTDAILEALVELRLTHDEIPEVAFARLADLGRWKGFISNRLPIADVPMEVRRNDPNLLFQPMAQLVSPDQKIVVKVGTNSISIHSVSKYLGWETGFKEKIDNLVADVFSSIKSVKVVRVGVRYINLFSRIHHRISGPRDLKLRVEVGSEMLNWPFQLQYHSKPSDNADALVRITSPEIVQGVVPIDGTVFVDIDVCTVPQVFFSDPASVLDWIDKAHEHEKNLFFGLLHEETIEELREK